MISLKIPLEGSMKVKEVDKYSLLFIFIKCIFVIVVEVVEKWKSILSRMDFEG
jgi:hypothetical protein